MYFSSSNPITSTKKKTKGESSTKIKGKTLFDFWKQPQQLNNSNNV